MPRILLVDDDSQALDSTRKILEFEGFEVLTAVDGQKALEEIRAGGTQKSFDLVITDVRMPRLGGLDFLRALSLGGEAVPVILMTAFGRVEDAVWAMKSGAVDFLTKPFKRQTLLSSVEIALKRGIAQGLRGSTGGVSPGRLIFGRSSAMRELQDLALRVAPTQASILLTGESGTGKELIARFIHEHSTRKNLKFVAINCAAVPEQLIESELFGFERGAFTGATSAKEGLFETAHGGTLLLDEIGDMPLAVQAKLLRCLQENEVRRVGATLPKKVDVRVIAATHRNLKNCVQEGVFRHDLLYRLEVVGIHIAPLRERLEDIPSLVDHFIKNAAQRHQKSVQSIDEETFKILLEHSWPGNVRELSNVIERAVVLAPKNSISPSELPSHLLSCLGSKLSSSLRLQSPSMISVPLGTSLRDVEDLLIRKTLEATAGDKNMTARLLGINSRTIYRKLDKRSEKDSDHER